MDLASAKSTASEVTAAIEAREISVAEGALYRYWAGQLCDTFIENSKPMLMPDVPERERKSAQQTLYTAVEGGLLLMHPIILFITEVLWQRLPRRQGDRTESIMVARYPEFEMALDAPQAAAEYKFLMDISAGIRSLLSHYDFKEASTILVQTYSRRAFQIVSAERTSLLSLGVKYLGKIVVLGPSAHALPPRGCALQSINSEAAVYVQILGRIDLAAEWRKRDSILDEVRKKVARSRSIMSKKGLEKANEQTKSRKGEILANAQSEVARIEETLHDLERLQLEFDE